MAWLQHDHADVDALIEEVARGLRDACREAIRARGAAWIALAGGRTPLPIYARLAASGLGAGTVTVIPTDERCVPHTHPACNLRAVREAFAPNDAIVVNGVSLSHAQLMRLALQAIPEHGAIAVGTELRHDFADSVCFVARGRVRTPDRVPFALAEALGLREDVRRPLTTVGNAVIFCGAVNSLFGSASRTSRRAVAEYMTCADIASARALVAFSKTSLSCVAYPFTVSTRLGTRSWRRFSCTSICAHPARTCSRRDTSRL